MFDKLASVIATPANLSSSQILKPEANLNMHNIKPSGKDQDWHQCDLYRL